MKYKIDRDMKLNGKRYKAGDLADLNAANSARLLRKGLVSEVKAPKPKKKVEKGDK